MLSVSVRNQNNDVLNFAGNANYILTNVDGVTPTGANINTSEIATKDGSVFNSARITNRNIVLTILPIGNVENNRVALYTYFKVKQKVTLYFTTATRAVFIQGYVESMETDLYSKQEEMQISIICPDPYLKDVNESVTDFAQSESSLQCTVNNVSDVPIGLVAEFAFDGTIENIALVNEFTMDAIIINRTFNQYQKLVIDTRQGEKGIYLLQGLTETNLINYMDLNSKFIQVNPGFTPLTVTINAGNLGDITANVKLQPIYEGV